MFDKGESNTIQKLTKQRQYLKSSIHFIGKYLKNLNRLFRNNNLKVINTSQDHYTDQVTIDLLFLDIFPFQLLQQ